MIVKIGYNSKVNDAFAKLGEREGFGEIKIHQELESKAQELMDALKDEVLLEIRFIDDTYKGRGALQYYGVTVAKASGRDSGAFVPPSVSLIEGSVGSGGSMKNWETTAEEGTVMRFKVPRLIYEKCKNLYSVIETKIVDENSISIDDLI